MDNDLELDLKKVMSIISSDWDMQSNYKDKASNFIYNVKTLEECLNEINKTGVNKNYALHRWYNYMTSVKCEYIFCEYGAKHDTDKYNHDVDIYINDIPFDVKLTVYPAKLSSRPYNLSTRKGKNEMIRWYYMNQSQQNRKQMLNRLYIVCDADSSYENMVLKSNFNLIRKKISSFMEYTKTNGFNEIEIIDNGEKHILKSDIIYIKKV